MFFTIFQNKKTPFQAIKTRSSKRRKIHIFPKGLTHCFGPKMAIFQPFLLRQYRQGKCLLRYSRRKKTPFQAIKIRSSKSPNIDIFSKGLTHGFGLKMAIFLNSFFQAIYAMKMSFTIFQHKKNALVGYKNKKFKRSKNSHFSKGVNPWFWSKCGHFLKLFFLGNISQENVFYDILERKNAFLGYKNKKIRMSKN